MNSENITISVIIPVYNASATLKSCLDSLHRQTYHNLELLFIDDFSTDDSLHMLVSYAEQYSTEHFVVKVLRHEQNRGVAAARNTGLANVTGEYVYYVDADDFIETDTLECLVKEAQEKGLDIVGHEWFLTFKSDERYMRQPVYATSDEALRQMICGTMRWNLWLFLVRRSLYVENYIRFIEGMDMGEDMMVMMKLFVCAKRVAIISRPFYHYVQSNSSSLTKTYSVEHIRQVTGNVHEVERFISGSPYAGALSGYIPLLKLNIKLPLLMTDDESRYKQWMEWFPEADEYIMVNKHLPLRTRLIQWAAARRYTFLLKLYHRLVFKLLYGVIYK